MKVYIEYRLEAMNPKPYGAKAYVGTTQTVTSVFLADSEKSFPDAKTKVLDKIRKIYMPVPEPEEIEIEL